ncbi:hypothetical protein BAMA_24150 [Bacillus manliponensis]|uniref:Endospore appendages core domain-containing protein n=1 Tax=Bacillus manliponensis TaxID=574376 RepID=A0A073JY09_9BACI|nr:S-Ena type endospore appendage [Bacillus manliponensis]KEK19107.1 hypothetical protein BAMA_24150 [Bacillus manliponensis]
MGSNYSGLSCCSNKTIVQDKVCLDWSIDGTGAVVVYTNNVTQEIVASGYVKYDVGVGDITVEFLVGTTPVETLTISPGSSAAFTVRRFTDIEITTAGVGEHQGEFCITLRYPIS